MTQIGTNLINAEINRLELAPALTEMYAFEQALGQNGKFYRYQPLRVEVTHQACRLRLLQRTPDGRVRLSRRGRRIAAAL